MPKSATVSNVLIEDKVIDDLIDSYKELNDKCDIILEKINKRRKVKTKK